MLEEEIMSESGAAGEVLVYAEDGRRVRIPFDLYNRLIPAGWEHRRLVLTAPGRFAVTTPWVLGLLGLAAVAGGAVVYLAVHMT
jgi:hypothetical protein